MRTINKVEGLAFYSGEALAIYDIYSVFSVPVDFINYNYTVIGLTKEVPIREAGGIKTESSYCSLIDGVKKAVLKKYFNYVYQDPDASKIGVWIEHLFLTIEGGEGIGKIEFVPMEVGEVASLRRKQRIYAISRLEAIGLELPEIATDIETLINHYNTEVDLFERFGTNDFYNSIVSETSPSIIAILDKVVTYQGITLTVRDAILNQLQPHYV